MRLVVADASALVEYLLGTERGARMRGAIESRDVGLHVPALCDVEFTAAIRRVILHGGVTVARGEEALADYLDLPLERHGHMLLLARVFQLRDNISAYDATYVALAERLNAAFLTADDALARGVSKHTRVELAVV